MREDGNEPGPHGVGLFSDAAFELLIGSANGEGALGVNQIHHGLRLCQIHFAIQEGSLSELSRIRLTCSMVEEGAENFLGNQDAAVAMNLGGVFTCVTRRALKQNAECMVDDRAIRAEDMTEMSGARSQFRNGTPSAKSSPQDGMGLRACEPNHADGCLPHRGGDGGDGVGSCHGSINQPCRTSLST